jgi:hypothetical protein
MRPCMSAFFLCILCYRIFLPAIETRLLFQLVFTSFVLLLNLFSHSHSLTYHFPQFLFLQPLSSISCMPFVRSRFEVDASLGMVSIRTGCPKHSPQLMTWFVIEEPTFYIYFVILLLESIRDSDINIYLTTQNTSTVVPASRKRR